MSNIENVLKFTNPTSLNDFVFMCMRDGKYWSYWTLQRVIKDKTGKFYGEPSISAAIRNLRKYEGRKRYGLPLDMSVEVVSRRRIANSRGYEFKLVGDTNG